MRSKRIKFSKGLKSVLFEKMREGITASEAVELGRKEIDTIPESSRIEAGDRAMIRTLLRSMGGWSVSKDSDGEGVYKLEESMSLEELATLWDSKSQTKTSAETAMDRIGKLIAEKNTLQKAAKSEQMLIMANEYEDRIQKIDQEIAAAAQG